MYNHGEKYEARLCELEPAARGSQDAGSRNLSSVFYLMYVHGGPTGFTPGDNYRDQRQDAQEMEGN